MQRNVRLERLPRSQATVLFGSSNTNSIAGPLPLDLGILGLTGCWLRVSPDVTITVAGANNRVTFPVTVPATPVLIGARFFLQAVVPDPQSGNAAGFVMSDAVAGVVGY